MKKVLLHDQQYSIGGPKAVLDGIVGSYLNTKFRFVRIIQTEACGFNPFKAIRLIHKYRILINREHADAIYICGLQYIGFLMTLAAKLSNVKKIVLSVHGSEWDLQEKGIREYLLMYIFEPLSVYLADSVITVCKSAQQTVGALRLGCHGNNQGVVYNTFPNIDPSSVVFGHIRESLRIPKDKIIVTSVGRVVAQKGHQYIIRTIKNNPDKSFVYVIVGDGPFLKEYLSQCPEEINNGTLFLLGKRTDVLSILKESDIFLFPTLNENHSIALLEAVNMRCCSICTSVGGNPEIIQDHKSGLLIRPNNSDDIITGLSFLKDPTIRKEYSENAFNFCKEEFSIANTYGKLEYIFDN